MRNNFLDIYEAGIAKSGEELRGDQVRIFRGEERTTVVLSDGLGSGVKANILATLTAQIIIKMRKADAPLADVIETVIGTLPICKERRIAYATFTIIEIEHRDYCFEAVNFDNPDLFYLRNGKLMPCLSTEETISGRKIKRRRGQLKRGDFLAIASDGIIYAGLGNVMNLGWGWNNVAEYMEQNFPKGAQTARSIVQRVIAKTQGLYGGNVGDDATLVGIFTRERHAVTVFTGPPTDKERDLEIIEKFLNSEGRKVVCGGTTGNIVAEYLGQKIDTRIETMTPEVPPIGILRRIDLLTEGIVTMMRTLELLRSTGGDLLRLPFEQNGAALLARELAAADSIRFIVGGQINAWYQNPLLPKNISIRKTLVREMEEFLRGCHKEVVVEYC